MTRDLNLRHLRLLVAVIDTGSVTRAAAMCNLSQPAVTQGLKSLEMRLGVPLFDRTAQGLFPNVEALHVAERVKRALDLLDDAAGVIAPRLMLTATTARLKALIAVAEAGNVSLAARDLGVSQPTVHRAITQLESEAGRPLFRRTSYGSTPTRAGRLLANAAQLAFAELAQAKMELAELAGQGASRITIGGMPLSRSYLLPRVIARFQAEHPRVRIRVLEGPYDTLLAGLRTGEIDMLFGALRPFPAIGDIVQTHLFDDTLAIVADPGHHLALQDMPDMAEAARCPWVVAMPGTPARTHFDAFMDRFSPDAPQCLVETSSMILMRELLREGRYLGCISRLQAEGDIRAGLMVALPFRVEDAPRPIGITTRANWKPTRSQAAFLRLVDEAFGVPKVRSGKGTDFSG